MTTVSVIFVYGDLFTAWPIIEAQLFVRRSSNLAPHTACRGGLAVNDGNKTKDRNENYL
jgi:hypothetical protein